METTARPPRRRWPLRLAVGVIVAHWIGFTAWQMLRADASRVPASVAELALRVAIRAALVTLVAWGLLRLDGDSLAGLGVTLARFGRTLGRGALGAVALFAVTTFIVNPVVGLLVGAPGGTSTALRGLFQDRRDAPYWVLCAILGGGFAEELERAFVLTRCERLFGKGGLVAAVLVGSLVFGTGHLYQGVSGAISAGITGALLALVFLRRRRAIDAMVVHAGFDLIGIAVAYGLYAR